MDYKPNYTPWGLVNNNKEKKRILESYFFVSNLQSQMSLYVEDQLEVGINHVMSFSFLLEQTHCFYLLVALIKQMKKKLLQSLTN